MTRRRNKATLEDTRHLLADVNTQIAEVRRKRADELRGAADDGELDKFDAEIKRLGLLASRHSERIALLEAAAAEAEAQRRVKEKESLIQRIEKKLQDKRHAAAVKIAEGIAMADKGLGELFNHRARRAGCVALEASRPGADAISTWRDRDRNPA